MFRNLPADPETYAELLGVGQGESGPDTLIRWGKCFRRKFKSMMKVYKLRPYGA